MLFGTSTPEPSLFQIIVVIGLFFVISGIITELRKIRILLTAIDTRISSVQNEEDTYEDEEDND